MKRSVLRCALRVLATVMFIACTERHDVMPRVGGLGKLIVPGAGSDLRLSPDQTTAAFIGSPVRPKLEGLPPQMAVGKLIVASLTNGASRVVGEGVTNDPGGFAFSPNSRWILFLQGYNAANRSGELRVLDLSQAAAKPVVLGSAVTFFTVSPDSAWVGFVDGGGLRLAAMGDQSSKGLGSEVTTAQFLPNSQALVYRRGFTAGGGLLLARVGPNAAPPLKLGEGVGDYVASQDSTQIAFTQVSPESKDVYDLYEAAFPSGPSHRVARGTTTFAFSPDSQWLGFTQGATSHKKGDLWVGKADGAGSRKIAEAVEEFSFSPTSAAVAALGKYDTLARLGTLYTAATSGGEPTRVSGFVLSYVWSSDGRHLAFNVRMNHPLPSIDLYLYAKELPKAVKVEEGVFGYEFSPSGQSLRYRNQCTKETRSCELRSLDLDKPNAQPKTLTSSIFVFRHSRDGQRILVSYARSDSDAYDTAVLNVASGERRTLDEYTLPPALFAAKDGTRVVYLISNQTRPGLYVSDQHF